MLSVKIYGGRIVGTIVKTIKFVSYDGAYPNLCSGTITLDVDGTTVELRHMLCSTGSVSWEGVGEVTTGPWHLYRPDEENAEFYDYHVIPKDIRFTKNELDYIEDLANENIPYGCCGGCM